MRLLLDSHVPRALAQQLQRHDVDAVALSDWMGGSYRNAPDDELLLMAYAERRVLFTYDCQTIPSLLKEWAETQRHHAGVVLVDRKTFEPRDVGGLLRSLLGLIAQRGNDDWEGRAVFLRAIRR